ncbi:Eco57I restriction-modification methylase domain-containing protein [Halorussus caseinilyticus]|uniref:site-specific DNA-methyltransferase (adenine-specific) n=2 Tax=Halorussus caseinilyticus TaxID=3034025 RepID=A0ABD5WP68_9EURY
MVAKLFEKRLPRDGDRILYPGIGTGPFALAVSQFCNEHDVPEPAGVGIELDPDRIETARDRLQDANVEIERREFLRELSNLGEFRYVVGNPPYVPIEGLDEEEKERYRAQFDVANGRFDLFALFFEQALGVLADDGRLVFVTPEKFEYTEATTPLRRLMTEYHVEEIEHLQEDAFDGHITFPTVTTIQNRSGDETRIVRRDGTEDTVVLPTDGGSWASTLRETRSETLESDVTLGEVTERISCGVATGADSVFVTDESEVPPQLDDWTYPTTSGRQLRINDGPYSNQVFICPYNEDGRLPPEDELGAFGDWAEMHRDRLEDRSCVEKGKQVWYGWHENPPLQDILQPKIVCKDVADEPAFWADREGSVVPRHSVYYLVPADHVDLKEMLDYLNSEPARAWIESHAQKAHNDFYRLQSKMLTDLPVPEEWGKSYQTTLV